jgi:glyoxylase-like metal-dependent hydrolase (beta-lactamase superfamily II)
MVRCVVPERKDVYVYKKTLTIVAALSISACASGPPEIELVNDAVDALGGLNTIMAVETLTIEGEGTMGNFGQNMGAAGAIHPSAVLDYTREMDLAQHRMKEQYRTERRFPFVLPLFDGGSVHNGIDGDAPYRVSTDGTQRAGGNAAALQTEFLRHPLTIIRAALEEGATIGPLVPDGDVDRVDVTTAQGLTLALSVDRATKLPQSVTTAEIFNGLIGDTAEITYFLDYEEVEGVMLPTTIRTVLDPTFEILQREVRVASNTLGADLSHLEASAEVLEAAASGGGGGGGGFGGGFFPGGGTQQPIVVTELAPGVHHFGGREASGGFQYNMVLVEFEDHMELFEPSSHGLALQAIEKARELFPDKPLTKMIVSHSHSDHAAGARTAVAEGLGLVVHESAKDYFDEVIRRPFAGGPDHLAMNPVEPQPTVGVGDHLRVEDATQTMDIYHIPGAAHADHLLYLHFPEHGILVDADMYNMDPGPGCKAPDIWPASMKTGVIPNFNLVWIDSLYEEIGLRELNVDTHVPIHGVPVAFERLRAYRDEWNEDGSARLEPCQ